MVLLLKTLPLYSLHAWVFEDRDKSGSDKSLSFPCTFFFVTGYGTNDIWKTKAVRKEVYLGISFTINLCISLAISRSSKAMWEWLLKNWHVLEVHRLQKSLLLFPHWNSNQHTNNMYCQLAANVAVTTTTMLQVFVRSQYKGSPTGNNYCIKL